VDCLDATIAELYRLVGSEQSATALIQRRREPSVALSDISFAIGVAGRHGKMKPCALFQRKPPDSVEGAERPKIQGERSLWAKVVFRSAAIEPAPPAAHRDHAIICRLALSNSTNWPFFNEVKAKNFLLELFWDHVLAPSSV
jgi:hypothetical protein